MKAVVFTSLATATAFSAAVDAAMGLPEAPRKDGACVTLRWCELLAHPEGKRWAYADTGVEAIVQKLAISMKLPAPVALEASWFVVKDPRA